MSNLGRLDHLGRAHLQLRTKDPIPKAACDAKALLVIRKVVLEVVFLELLVVWRQSIRISNSSLHVETNVTYFW
jgi:hypothetical protein